MLDAAFFSHVIFWLIGGIVVIGGITSVGAMFLMGRSDYRKD